MTEKVDVLIVGAGISGIAAAYYLGERCPHLSWTIVEGRAAIGGTWDLFRYPGVRSDSDMYTLGYRFRPWTGEKAIADGSAILQYLKDTAREFGIDRKIRFHHRVTPNILVIAGGRMDGGYRAPFAERAAAIPLQLPLYVHRLLSLRPRLHARLARHGRFRRRYHPSARLAQ